MNPSTLQKLEVLSERLEELKVVLTECVYVADSIGRNQNAE